MKMKKMANAYFSFRSSWYFVFFMTVFVSDATEPIGKTQEPISSTINRRIRGLSYPDDSEMGLFFALAVPLDDPLSTKAISVAFFFEANYQLTNSETEKEEVEQEERGTRSIALGDEGEKIVRRRTRKPISRGTIYLMLESKFESLGFPGRACLLRSICETSGNPLHRHNGLLGDLLRILFTPSSSLDENLSDDYTRAEFRSDGMKDDCSVAYPLCPLNIYDYITSEETNYF